MTIMTDTEAREIIESMRDTAVSDTVSISRRLEELKKDYAEDPHELTFAQIKRVEARLVKRIEEAKALAVAATKF